MWVVTCTRYRNRSQHTDFCRKINIVICNHQTDCPQAYVSDEFVGKLREKLRIFPDTKCPYWGKVLLNSILLPSGWFDAIFDRKLHENSSIYIPFGMISACVNKCHSPLQRHMPACLCIVTVLVGFAAQGIELIQQWTPLHFSPKQKSLLITVQCSCM